jgi:hypothetical protein
MNDKVKEFNACIDLLANEHKLRVIEFNFDDDDFFDGVHLNSKGCHTAANQLSDVILRDKGFESTSDLS